jgi:hypothetical protein
MAISTTVSSLVDFLSKCLKEADPVLPHDRLVLYRGHRNKLWKLKPRIARDLFDYKLLIDNDPARVSAERRLFNLFRDSSLHLMPAHLLTASKEEVGWISLSR